MHAFWDEVTVMLHSQGITFKSPDIKDIFFGLFDAPNHDSDGILLTVITLYYKVSILFIVPSSIRLLYLSNHFSKELKIRFK